MNDERLKNLKFYSAKKAIEAENKAKGLVTEFLIGEKGDKGDKGVDAKPPTTQELVKIIKPLIPAPIKGEDGKTPSKTELKDLIQPLIPLPIAGKAGKDGKDGTIFTYVGTWEHSHQYKKNDIVTRGGSSFLCLKDHTSANANEPDAGYEWVQYWGIIARKGEKGERGRSGGGSGGGGATALSQLTDVTIVNPVNGEVLKYNGSKWVNGTAAGGGDMTAAVYDPQNIASDAFDQDNMTDGTTNKNFTATEKTKLSGIEAGADVTDAANVDAAGATMNTDSSLAGNSYFLDEDNMASDSATKVPSQQSVKAYADNKLAKSSNLSDVANAATAFNNIKQAASDTATGVVELATTAETDTGTDTGRAVTPDGLAGSYAGTKPVSIEVIQSTTAVTTGDGKCYFRIPPSLNGMNLVTVGASVFAKSTSGTPTIQIARGRQANATSAHTFADMLSTAITIDANEYDSKDATTAAVIDAANDDVLTGDLIRVDVDVAGTAATGLYVTLQFRLP